jgi:predicted CoA-substrate-specific enzyme activase
MTYIGVNLGALTVKVVALHGKGRLGRVEAHQGRPLEVLKRLLAEPEFADAAYFGVSGHLGHISEAAAIQRALKELAGEFEAVVSLGGESFLVYIFADGRTINVLSHNQCAAGSGEFFVQQIGRMNLGIEEAIRRSCDGKIVPLSSRCSVHCKSDITHKLNRHEATIEDVLRTLHDSMASKVVALLEKSQCILRRVLLIGGVTRNGALVAALREKMPTTEFVVLPESPWFEAWGSALIARDEPVYTSPQVSAQPGLGTLPPLNRYADRVHVVAAPPRRFTPDAPMVLGVDAGSTTTKAVLLDPSTRDVVASHYARTSGDPINATRVCLSKLIDQVGDSRVGLVGTTGSARELVGSYLGTEHVYNEISAHVAGATRFDPDVDTIFEIGGQDSKYVSLRDGVPVDYAMNNTCSAGTGSFLEESAQGDLGISVGDIAGIAETAEAPVHFKATCAAFINSDVRLALQQGRSREDVVAGLVYAIAGNYLARVKGPRPVGKHVFLQGGVALNRAIGEAFAHSVNRDVIIPPSPELLGAQGVALLALDRSETASLETNLSTLAAPEMRLVGRFTCKACGMYCGIDRFEVDGRRFPFGGRCSLYESVWKRKSRVTSVPDLVERRAGLVFGARPKTADSAAATHRIGIPRALTTHSLYPLYSTFFSELGMEVVLSDTDPGGDLKAYSGFCFPMQIAHRAVLDLARHGTRLVFMPHVVRMPQLNPCRDSYLCPISQAAPDVLGKAFPDMRFLSPVFDFTNGYDTCLAMVETAVSELGTRREVAEQAWNSAVRAQTAVDAALRDLGSQALAEAVARGKPAILLAGHSYNAFSPEASQSVGKKLSSMGVTVIPADCLLPVTSGATSWHFPNQLLNAAATAKQHPNLFLVAVSNFGCTIDAFTHSMLTTEMGGKPYLVLEIDAHAADAGVQTRLEAFLEIIGHHREGEASRTEPFAPCRLAQNGQVVRSNGEHVRLTDPRVKIYFPNFSPYHTHAMTMAVRWLGMHAGAIMPLDRSSLDRGLQYTSGRECLPLPICVGQLLQVHEQRSPGEIAGFYMPRGGAPCVLDAYMGYLERFITDERLSDLFLFDIRSDDCGFNPAALRRSLSAAVLVADILVEVEQVLRVVGRPGSVEQLGAAWGQFVAAAGSMDQFHRTLPAFVNQLAALPRTREPRDCPRVVVTGDFFTRFSPFFMEGVHDLYHQRGIILKPVDLSDIVLHEAYDGVSQVARGWGIKPGGLALAKACTRIFQPEGQRYFQQLLSYEGERWSQHYYRGLFRQTGLLVPGPDDVSSRVKEASEQVSPTIYSEALQAVGMGLDADRSGYDGIILIGPFNCLALHLSEAILKPLSIRRGMPLLTYESDGCAVSPAFLRQVDVHIQAILDRASGAHERLGVLSATG